MDYYERKTLSGEDMGTIGGGEYILLCNEFLKKHSFIFHLTEDGSISYNYEPENESEFAKYIFGYRIHFDFENYYKNFEAALEDFYGRLREGMTDAEIAYILYSALAKKNVTEIAEEPSYGTNPHPIML